MADIFISYSTVDAELTKDLACDLESEGYTTWWDTSLLPGEEFPAQIQREVEEAQAVIVIWTKSSIKSRWVLAEAYHAGTKLISVRAIDFAAADIPIPFNTIQSVLVIDKSRIFSALKKRYIKPSNHANEKGSATEFNLSFDKDKSAQSRAFEPNSSAATSLSQRRIVNKLLIGSVGVSTAVVVLGFTLYQSGHFPGACAIGTPLTHLSPNLRNNARIVLHLSRNRDNVDTTALIKALRRGNLLVSGTALFDDNIESPASELIFYNDSDLALAQALQNTFECETNINLTIRKSPDIRAGAGTIDIWLGKK